MSIAVTFRSADRVLLTSDFLFARRPVVDRALRPVAHELLFCAPQGSLAAQAQPANASVIADVCNHGVARVLGDLQGMLYLDAGALMSGVFDFLPADRMILELEPLRDREARERMARLAAAGFRFGVSAQREDDILRAMLPLVMGVRIDVQAVQGAALESLVRAMRAAGKLLLAEGVDTPEMFRHCLALGFDFFLGYHFAVPVPRAERKLGASQRAIAEIMTLIDTDADDAEIEERIKCDVALGLKLLHMANASAFGHRRVNSLRQALLVVGRSQLRRWLQLSLYADAAREGRPAEPLLMLAATRGRLMELTAQKLRPGNRDISDAAFTVGIMSLMDTLFSMPMAEILEQMPVSEDVAGALLEHEGYLGKLLSLAVHTEWAADSDAALRGLLEELRLGCSDLYALQLAAYEWCDTVVREATLD